MRAHEPLYLKPTRRASFYVNDKARSSILIPLHGPVLGFESICSFLRAEVDEHIASVLPDTKATVADTVLCCPSCFWSTGYRYVLSLCSPGLFGFAQFLSPPMVHTCNTARQAAVSALVAACFCFFASPTWPWVNTPCCRGPPPPLLQTLVAPALVQTLVARHCWGTSNITDRNVAE